jgi:AcrR family transcriptional regulator
MPPRPDVSAQRRTQIIEAAMTCFTRKGYTNTTMDDIVTESGLSKGSLYWYFDSKEALFTSAVTSFFEEFGQETMASLLACGTATERMRCGGRAMAEFCQRAQGLFSLLLEFWSQSERREKVGQQWADMLGGFAKLVAAVVEEGVVNGEFRPVDTGPLAWAILAAYDGLAAYILMKPDLDLERISEAYIETLLGGLLVEAD